MAFMKFIKVPEEHRMVPINIRGDASRESVTIHKKWTDVDLLNLWVQCKTDKMLINSSLGLTPAEVLV